MIGTTVTVPRDKLTAWHWINKEHPFQLVSHDQYKRTYTGVCGSTDYVFRCLAHTDKELTLKLTDIVTPARKATPALSALRTGTVSEQLVRENARLVSENEKLKAEKEHILRAAERLEKELSWEKDISNMLQCALEDRDKEVARVGYRLVVAETSLSAALELNAQDRSRIALREKSQATEELEHHPITRLIISLKKPPLKGDVLRAHKGDTGSTVTSVCGDYVHSRGNGTGYTYTWRCHEADGVHVLFGVGAYAPS